MTDFTMLYCDTILKKLVAKIKRDQSAKQRAEQRRSENAEDGRSVRTQRHWKAAADSEFYYKEIVIGYERMRDLDQLTRWSEKLYQERFGFLNKYEDVLKTYLENFKEEFIAK